MPGRRVVFSDLQLLLSTAVEVCALKLAWETFGLGRIERQGFWGLWPWVVLLSQQPRFRSRLIPPSYLPSMFLALTSVAVFDNVSRLRLTDMHPQITYV